MRESIVLPFYVRLALVVTSLIGLGYLCVLGESFLSPLFMASLFAILLLPLSNFLEKRCHFPRALASSVCVIVLIVVVSGVVFLMGNQLTFLIHEWPNLQKQLNHAFRDFQSWIEEKFHYQASEQLNYINGMTSKALATGTSVLGSALLSVSSLLFFFVFTLLYTFFILFYRKRLLNFLLAVFGKEHSDTVLNVVHKVQYMIKMYITGLFIEMGVVTAISAIVFWILGSKYVLLLSLVTSVFNIIPYIGIFCALIISALITFATATPIKALFISLAVLSIHTLDSNILMPQILGSKIRVNALVIILGVIIGEMLWGIVGMFVAIPVLAILKIIFDHVEKLKPWAILLGEEAEPKAKKKRASL